MISFQINAYVVLPICRHTKHIYNITWSQLQHPHSHNDRLDASNRTYKASKSYRLLPRCSTFTWLSQQHAVCTTQFNCCSTKFSTSLSKVNLDLYSALLIFSCTIKSKGSLLAPAHPGGAGKRAVKWLWCGGMNHTCHPLLPARASPHIGWYSFSILLRAEGWVGLSRWLQTKLVYTPADPS